jgi:hypothetical protein
MGGWSEQAYFKRTNTMDCVGGAAQAVKHQPNKWDGLSWNPTTSKKQNKTKHKWPKIH